MEEELKKEKDIDIAEGLINKIKNFLLQKYEPAFSINEADIYYSTRELFDKLQSIYPSLYYSAEDVAEWMHMAGYTFEDMGNMRFKWLIKTAV